MSEVTQEEANSRFAEAMAIELPEAEPEAEVKAVEPEQPAPIPFCAVPVTPGMFAAEIVPSTESNGKKQPAVQLHVAFDSASDVPQVIQGECCLEERDHCWACYVLGEDGQYRQAPVGYKPNFIEFKGKPVVKWHSQFGMWCLAIPTSMIQRQS